MMRPTMLAFLSAALYLCAFYVPYAWPLTFVVLIPLIMAARRARTATHAALLGYFVGAVSVGASTVWMLMVPTAFTSPTYLAGLLISWVLVLIVLGLSHAAWAALLFRMRKRTGWVVFLVSVLSFVLFEYLRMHAFNILTYAPHIENPAFFSPGFLGYPLADNPAFLQLATLGGIYFMSLVAVFVNVGIATLLSHKHTERYVIAVVALLALGSLMPVDSIRTTARATGEQSQIGFMSIHAEGTGPEGGRREAESYKEDVSRAVEELTRAGADVILLPEGAKYFPERAAPDGVTVLGTVRITSAEDDGRGYLSAFAGTGNEEPRFVRTKQALTPQGEYPIALFTSILGVFGKAHLIDEFRGHKGFRSGPEGEGLVLPDVRASVFFCIEMFHPGLGKALVEKEDTQVIFAVMSHAFFFYSNSLTVDTERALKVQAVQAGVPLVASADFGVAFSIDKYGRVLTRLGDERVSEWAVTSVAR